MSSYFLPTNQIVETLILSLRIMWHYFYLESVCNKTSGLIHSLMPKHLFSCKKDQEDTNLQIFVMTEVVKCAVLAQNFL